MSRLDVARRIAGRFDSPFLQGYAFGKLLLDPVYGAVLGELSRESGAIFDVGCGIGLAALFLREHGIEVPITGIDFDERKIAAARAAAAPTGAEFRVADAREAFPEGGTILLLDVLHYFSRSDQESILRRAAASGGMVIIRDAMRDGSWRFAATAAAETFARAVTWLKGERLNFLRRDEIEAAFAGFEADVKPMYGVTPFNNYLLVFRRASSGITNS